jgi:lipopolysaccharide assembly outer membrane protein LptD (OstA)
MNHAPVGRSFYGIAFGVLLMAGGAVSLVASARQAPPSAAQAKRASQNIPSSAPGKQSVLPGFGKSADPRNGSADAPVSGGDPQKKAHLDMDDPDLNERTGLARGKNLVYTEGDMRFTGQTAVYKKSAREFDAQGSLELDDPKHHVTGDKSHVDLKKQLAVIKGSVVITLKPTLPDPSVPTDPANAKQRRFPVIITCDRAEDSYKRDFIILNGHLVFKQAILKDDGKMVERTLTAEHAEYDGKTNKLHLFQPVKAFDSEGQNIEFEKDAYVGTKEGEETLTSTGKSKINFNLDDAGGDDSPVDKKDATPPPVVKKPN